MTPWIAGGGAVVIAAVAGAGLVLTTWPRAERLTGAGAAGLSLLLGPWIVGLALMAGSPVAGSSRTTVWLVSLASLALAAYGATRWRACGHAPRLPRHALAHALLVLSVLATTSLALRTHLGWDGTVVWYHKARMLAQSAGRMPVETMQDTTRTWTAPDYPLHVPLAEAWLLMAMGTDDERVLKLLPAAWCAGILCLVFAAVRDPRGELDTGAPARAAAAVLVLVSAPRLLVGEGSFTSGYADGPMSGLLAALLWIAWRSDWGRESAWQPLLAVLSLALVWTKQEGLAVAVVMALACALRAPVQWRVARFVAPALLLGAGWHVWVRASGAPVAMAYKWPGASSFLGRLVWVPVLYVREAVSVGTWGLFWPAAWVAAIGTASANSWRPLSVVAVALAAGAAGLTVSGWPDVAQHVIVTAPRQLIQWAPSLVMAGFAPHFGRDRSISLR